MIGLVDIIKLLCSDGVIKSCKTGWCHVGYVIHYTKNIQKLEDEIVGLENEWRRVDGSVQRARNNTETVEPDVWQWLMSAYGMKAEVEMFLVDMERENKWCFKCRCPNIYWRYWLGKESKKKTARVISLTGDGTKYMTSLVSHHSPPRDPEITSSEEYEAFDSRKHIFQEIMKALEDPGIKMIVVYGMGGVGKTTMVKEVCKLAERKKLFDSIAMATVSRGLDKEKVQGELATQLGLKLEQYGRASQLLKRLNNAKKNLVILDDVWEPLKLEDIGIPITNGGNKEPLNFPKIGVPSTSGSYNGCKVVITSRKKKVCQMIRKKNELKDFHINELTETEAWSLFTKEAEISVDSEIHTVAKDVCNECGGLPVAIRAVAAALKGKDKYAWKDAYRQLKNSKLKEIVDIDPKLFSSLKLSYDLLTPKDAQSCFLLCSLFPEDAEISINDLVNYSFGMRLFDQIPINSLEDVRERVLTLVDGLKSSCLLLDVKYKDAVKMHDVIRDVAISIAEDDKRYLVKHDIEKWPEKDKYEHCSAISLSFTNKIQELPNELECRGLHTLVLKCSSPLDIPNKFFNGMENNLEVLDLSKMSMLSLPSSLSTLVKLRMLCLTGCERDVSLLARLRNLEILSLDWIKDTGGLCELKYPEVKGCDDGEHVLGTPEKSIETQLQSQPGSFCKLCQLHVQHCQSKFLFPISVARGLVRLQYLEIKDCPGMEEIIRNERQGDNDEIIFHQLKELVLVGIHNLRSFCSSTKSTSTTEANNSYPLQPLFCEKVAFPALEILKIHRVRKISVIWDKQLKPPVQEERESFCQLRTLAIRNCENLKAIVVANREGGANDKPLVFPELLSLRLSDLNNLRSFFGSYGLEEEEEEEEITKHELHVEILSPQPFFNEKVKFPALEILTILRVRKISVIWDKQLKPPVQEERESFCQLRTLAIRNCENLKAIVVANREGGANDKPLVFPELLSLRLGDLNNLRSFFGSYGLEEEEEEEEEITKHELHVEILSPQPFFNEKVVFPCLEELVIWGVNIKQIWISTPPTNSFNNLTHLCIWECQNLLYLGPSELLVGSLQNLQSLGIGYCGSIEEVFIKTRGSNAGEGIIVSGDDDDDDDDEATTTEQVQISHVLPQLNEVYFHWLPRLRRFCSGYKLPRSILKEKNGCPLLESADPNMPNL